MLNIINAELDILSHGKKMQSHFLKIYKYINLST